MSHISDTIIRIKNAAAARRQQISVPYSKMNKSVLSLLVKEGFLEEVKEEKGKKNLISKIRYEERIPIITDCEIISRPSLRIYKSVKEIAEQKKGNLGIIVISTNKGIMTTEDAKKKGLGGELFFRVW